MDEKTIVEINGVKMEVDLRTATVVRDYRVGDAVKLLRKRYSDYETLPAVIVGFVAFQNLPTIELLSVSRNGEVEFHSYNDKSEGLEIAPFNKMELTFSREAIVEKLQAVVTAKEEELRIARSKRDAFLSSFGKIFQLEDKTE